MKFKHHLIRKYNQARNVSLWKWIVIILLIVAMPLFFALVRTEQIQQVTENQG